MPPVPTPSPTSTLSPTPNPLDLVRFVDNDDCQENIDRDILPTTDLTIKIDDSSHELVVEIADDGEERAQGLMCRETVPIGTGMLFVFQQSFSLNFWMFNTYQPLDILYLDESRQAVRAVRMEPCPRPEGYERDAWSSECSIVASAYGSGTPALYALELPAGWLESIGVQIDKIDNVKVSW